MPLEVLTIFINSFWVYLAYRQNEILKEQNRIMREQGGNGQAISEPKRLKSYWPIVAMLVLTLVMWAAVGFNYFGSHRQFPEFDSPGEHSVFQLYGKDTPMSCFYQVDGTALMSMRDHYKLAIGCFVFDGKTDVLDAPNLQVGNLYDIAPAVLTLKSAWGDSFTQYRAQNGMLGSIHIAVLLVPDNVQPSQFSSLRQARSLGVRILRVSIAPTL